MGMLVNGEWQDAGYETSLTGHFERRPTTFRNWVTEDGSPGPTGSGDFVAERNRYHLYVSLACPWAHRTLIMRALKRLEDKISVSVVHWLMAENGWSFAPGPGVVDDGVNGARHLHEIYAKADRGY